MVKKVFLALTCIDALAAHRHLVRKFSTKRVEVPRCTTTLKETIEIKEVNGSGIITLNRPQTLNTITPSMASEVYSALETFENTKRLVILRNAGNKAFSAGGNVKYFVSVLQKLNDDQSVYSREIAECFEKGYKITRLINTYKKPFVAMMNGMTIGGGTGFCVHGKYRIATENTVYSIPENAIGFFPDMGNTHFMPRLKGKLGLFLGLTGYRLTGVDVLSAGIATHYVPSNQLEAVSNELLLDNSSVDAVLQSYAPENVKQNFSLAPHIPMIDSCFSASTVEEIVRRLRDENSEFSKDVLQHISKMSPTSLKVTKKAFEEGSRKTLDECLKMEYRLFWKCYVKNGDYVEGVRAKLVDKDQNPNWNPKTLEEVSDESINRRFDPMSPKFELPI